MMEMNSIRPFFVRTNLNIPFEHQFIAAAQEADNRELL